MMKSWIYENHIYELRSEELNKVWSSLLYKQLLQLRKESLKKKIIILSRVYNEPIQRPAPRWLVNLTGRAMHWYRRGQGLEFPTSLNFFQAYLIIVKTVRILPLPLPPPPPTTAAENRTTFLSLCVCGLTNKPIMCKKFNNTWAAGR